MKKKILALCLVIVLAVTAVTGATLAYFTDTKVATNTFTVGNIEIKLDEAPIDENGKKIENVDRVTKNDYTDLYPSQILDKDPTVTVLKGSEACYVRMKVTVDAYSQLTEAFDEGSYYANGKHNDGAFLLQNLVGGWDNSVWEYKSFDPKTSTYEFWYTSVVAESASDTELAPLFTTITIPAHLTNSELAKLEGIKITVTADAMQAANGDTTFTAEQAWAAFN